MSAKEEKMDITIDNIWPRLEVDLVVCLENFINEGRKFFSTKRPTAVIKEADTGKNIADLVALYGGNKKNRTLNAEFTIAESVLLSNLRNFDKVSIEDILEEYDLKTLSSIKNKFSKLFNLKIIKIVNNYILPNKDLTHVNIIAFEAKLRDWRKAIKQAHSYLLYADESYVVLPKKFSSPALKNIELFKKYKVGLIILDQSSLVIACKAESNSNFTWKREFLLSRSIQQGA